MGDEGWGGQAEAAVAVPEGRRGLGTEDTVRWWGHSQGGAGLARRKGAYPQTEVERWEDGRFAARSWLVSPLLRGLLLRAKELEMVVTGGVQNVANGEGLKGPWTVFVRGVELRAYQERHSGLNILVCDLIVYCVKYAARRSVWYFYNFCLCFSLS